MQERVYIDETGMDRDDAYPYGWSDKGSRCHACKPGGTKERISIIAALNQGSLKAPCYFTGYCNADVFNAWIEQALIPELIPGQTVIMDNARFHQSEQTKILIENAGCKLLFLPPYSPDYNPIEHAWFPIKNAARKILATLLDLPIAIGTAILTSSQSLR